MRFRLKAILQTPSRIKNALDEKNHPRRQSYLRQTRDVKGLVIPCFVSFDLALERYAFGNDLNFHT